jgi:endoglycosylceramidase
MTRDWRIALLCLLVVLTAAVTYPGTMLLDFSLRPQPDAADPASAASPSLPWLHVDHPAGERPFIADPQGRQILLRGVVTGGLVDYWSGANPSTLAPLPFHPIDPAAYENGRCPPNSVAISEPALCQQDLAQMHALGFDVVRLALSWSLLEPQPGTYDQRYLDRVAQVVAWAKAQGIYVIIDMHENAYSRYVSRPDPVAWPGGSPTDLNSLSGAPAWAVLTDGLPSEVYGGQRELNPALNAAFTNFWLNRWVSGPVGNSPGRGLQDHYIGAIAALARQFKNDSTVVGYSLFNEPWPGFIVPPLFEDLYLFPFYRRAIDAITGVRDGLPCPASSPAAPVCGYPDLGIHDRSQLFFVEPDHLRSQTDFPTNLPAPVSSYGGLVYSIHTYTHVFTLDALAGQDPTQATYPPGGFDTAYANAEAEAKSLNAALFVSEYGNQPSWDGQILASQVQEQERHQVGSTFWAWKENCSFGTPWGVYAGPGGSRDDQRCAAEQPSPARTLSDAAQNGCLRTDRERLLARVWPRAVGGQLISYAYDSAHGSFHLEAKADAHSPQTLVEITPEVRGSASARGAARIVETESHLDGSRLLHVQPTGGTYQVTVAAAPLKLSGCD